MPNPGEELRKLLLKEGTLDRVETAIQRQKIEEQSDTLRGGWHTEASLQKEGWTQSPSWRITYVHTYRYVFFSDYMDHISHLNDALRQMIDFSKKWAQSRNLCYRREIHGEEEWRVPVQREFKLKETNRTSTTSSASFVTQDWNKQTCQLFWSCSFISFSNIFELIWLPIVWRTPQAKFWIHPLMQMLPCSWNLNAIGNPEESIHWWFVDIMHICK